MNSSKTIANLGNTLINLLPFMTSTAAAITVYSQAKDYDGIGPVLAIIYSIVLEVLGTGSVTMVQYIDKHNKDYTAKKYQISKWPVWFIYGFQLVVGIAVVIGLDLKWKSVIMMVLFYLLSVPGVVLFSLNYRIAKIQSDYDDAKKQRKLDKQNQELSKPAKNTNEQTTEQNQQPEQKRSKVKSVKPVVQNDQSERQNIKALFDTMNQHPEQNQHTVQNVELDEQEKHLLELISENGNKTKDQYAELMEVSRGTVYNVKNRLVKKGLITNKWKIINE